MHKVETQNAQKHTEKPVIIARGLQKAYAGFAPVLRGVDIEVMRGELVAIMGPSGCGKSTMLHILGMLHAPDKGSLEILGTDVLTFTREQVADFRRGNMGFVMQSNNLFEHSTVFENVEFPLIYERVPPQERWERVIRALELVRLSARVHYRSNRLSGGEQQRVAIARAMVNEPKILLADEPTGALDARTSRLIMESFRTLCHASGVAMVMVTHDPKMAEYCDSIYTLEEGLLVCKKHEPYVNTCSEGQNLLAPKVPTLRGAYVAERLPAPSGQVLVACARRLYEAGALARIYTLTSAGLLGDPEGYSLPLAIRRISPMRILTFGLKILTPSFWKALALVHPSLGKGFRRTLSAVLCGLEMAKWVRQEKIDYLAAADCGRSATAAMVAATLTGIPFGFAAHVRDLLLEPEGLLATKACKASYVRVPTEGVRALAEKKLPLLAKETFLTLRDGQTLLPSEETERLMQQPADRVLSVLACGSLLKDRGLDVLLHAVSLLQKQLQMQVKIAGTGPEKSALAREAKRLGGLQMVSFVGQLPPEQMEDFFASGDVFVAPWRAETTPRDLPISLLEAMRFQLPIIASDLPVLREILVHGKNSLLIAEGDAKALASAIVSLSKDIALRKRLGAQGKADVQAFDKVGDVGMLLRRVAHS